MARDKSNGLSEQYIQDSSESESGITNNAKPSSSTLAFKTSGHLATSIGDSSKAEKIVSATESENSSDNSGSDSHISTSSNSSESSGHKRRTSKLTEATSQRPKKRSKKGISPPRAVPPKRFVPPSGFNAIVMDSSDYSTTASQMFDDLEGKQIWHITAPASVPITVIKSLDVQAALRGDPVLEHSKVHYNLQATSTKDDQLLLPGGQENDYSKSSAGIARNFHLREVVPTKAQSTAKDGSTEVNQGVALSQTSNVNRPDETDVPNFFAQNTATRPPPRKQPEGLKMRYKPYGTLVSDPDVLPPPDAQPVENDTVPLQSHHLEEPSPKKKKSKKQQEFSQGSLDAMDIDVPLSQATSTSSPVNKKKQKRKD